MSDSIKISTKHLEKAENEFIVFCSEIVCPKCNCYECYFNGACYECPDCDNQWGCVGD